MADSPVPGTHRSRVALNEERTGFITRDTQYAKEFVGSNRVLKLCESANEVVVGACEPRSPELRKLLESFHRKRVSFAAMSRSQLSTHLAKATLAEQPASFDSSTAHRLHLDRLANEAPVVNLVNGLLLQAVRAGASDIHIESGSERSRVRLRVDGRLSTVDTLAAAVFPAISTRIKLVAGLNIMERRIPQDGRVTVNLEEVTADIRVSSVPTRSGESIVIRIFPSEARCATLDRLGFRRADAAALQAVAGRPAGLVLTTGPTGSGKSTTLATLLRLLATDEKKIITIEDPVEQVLANAVQLQTDERIGLSFDRLLRHVLRQDPNIVMLGEIRDTPTCELAVRASLTGHLILSTLHTGGAVAAVDRLRNLGTPAYLIAEVLQASLAQRLVRRLCPRCKSRAPISRRLLQLLRDRGLSESEARRPVGCPECNGSGYAGRLPLLELFVPDDDAREMIASGAPAVRIQARETSKGIRSLLDDGLEKVALGLTSIEELRTVVEVP